MARFNSAAYETLGNLSEMIRLFLSIIALAGKFSLSCHSCLERE
jgi:hypothetical protein